MIEIMHAFFAYQNNIHVTITLITYYIVYNKYFLTLCVKKYYKYSPVTRPRSVGLLARGACNPTLRDWIPARAAVARVLESNPEAWGLQHRERCNPTLPSGLS